MVLFGKKLKNKKEKKKTDTTPEIIKKRIASLCGSHIKSIINKIDKTVEMHQVSISNDSRIRTIEIFDQANSRKLDDLYEEYKFDDINDTISSLVSDLITEYLFKKSKIYSELNDDLKVEFIRRYDECIHHSVYVVKVNIKKAGLNRIIDKLD